MTPKRQNGAPRDGEPVTEESAKRAVPVRVPVREQRRAPHQQSRDKITTRLMGEMELRRWPRRSRRRQDRVTTAATLATSVSHVSAVGSAPSKLAGALMPCFRRTASCAENRHAPMLREVGHGGWVGGPASGCSVRRSGVQRSRAQVKGAICYRGRPCASARTTSRDAPAPRRHRSPRQLTSASSAWQRKRRWTR